MKAIIPIAGKGTRMSPITSVIPKALLPLVDSTGTLKTVLQVNLEQVQNAGIDEAGIIVSPGQEDLIDEFFRNLTPSETSNIPKRIEYIEQKRPNGFGDAVYQSKAFLGEDSFILLLGDFIHINGTGRQNCIMQVKGAFASRSVQAMIGVQAVSESVLSLVGVSTGVLKGDNLYQATKFIEKPTREQARMHLNNTKGLHPGSYLGHCGIYAFSSNIFAYIEKAFQEAQHNDVEVELARAQWHMLNENPKEYYLYQIQGQSYDTGTPEMYAKAFEAWHGIAAN